MGAIPVLVSPPFTKSVDASRFPVTLTDEIVLKFPDLPVIVHIDDKLLMKLGPMPPTFSPPFTKSVDVKSVEGIEKLVGG
tara:strand:- start:26 stop:265 length:240 start_codon:yes stop_codon:yes gene_type:complete